MGDNIQGGDKTTSGCPTSSLLLGPLTGYIQLEAWPHRSASWGRKQAERNGKYIWKDKWKKQPMIESVSHNLFVWKWSEVKWKLLSHVQLFGSPWNSPGQNTGVDSLSLLQGIFPTQGLNPGLPHCRQILYQLSHKGNPFVCKVELTIGPTL